jgi:hypothetical protein
VSDDGQFDRVVAAALVVVLGAALAALFWLGREIPVDYGCGETAPPGNDLDAFRRGAPIAHAFAALLLLGTIAALSWRRNRRRGIDRPGKPTVVVAAIVALVTLVAVVNEDVGAAVIALSLVTSGLVYGLVVGAACLVVGAGIRGPAGLWVSMVGLWQAAVGAVPLHALLVYMQGHGPILC